MYKLKILSYNITYIVNKYNTFDTDDFSDIYDLDDFISNEDIYLEYIASFIINNKNSDLINNYDFIGLQENINIDIKWTNLKENINKINLDFLLNYNISTSISN